MPKPNKVKVSDATNLAIRGPKKKILKLPIPDDLRRYKKFKGRVSVNIRLMGDGSIANISEVDPDLREHAKALAKSVAMQNSMWAGAGDKEKAALKKAKKDTRDTALRATGLHPEAFFPPKSIKSKKKK